MSILINSIKNELSTTLQLFVPGFNPNKQATILPGATVNLLDILSVETIETMQPHLVKLIASGAISTQTTVDSSNVGVDDTTFQGNTFNGPNQLVQINPAGKLPAVDGSLLTGIVSITPASTTVLGVTKLSTAPGSPSNPIAVGNNDPRLNDPRVPTPHASSHQDGSGDELNLTGLSGTLADKQKVELQKGGVTQGTRPTVNLIEGANVTLTVADNPGQNRVDITVAGSSTAPATELATTGASVGIGSSIPPTTGQVLTATNATHATWQDQTGGINPYAGTGSFIKTNSWTITDGNGARRSIIDMVYDGVFIWACVDSDDTRLYKIDLAGVVVSRVDVGLKPQGLAFAMGFIWFIAKSIGNIPTLSVHKFNMTTGLVTATYGSGRELAYITANASYIFVSDKGNTGGVVLRLDPVVGTFNNVLEIVSIVPDAIATDGGATLWIINRASTTINRVDRDSGAILGTVDVSASGFPRNAVSTPGFVWVTMSNGDLLKVDSVADTVNATFPSGSPSLSGVTADGPFVFASESSPGNKIRIFDVNAEYFVNPFAAGNIPDDVVWDGANNIWVIDRTSTTIRRLDRRTGILLGTISTSAYGALRRGVSNGGFLWVVTASGYILKIDSTDAIISASRTGKAPDVLSPTNLSGGVAAAVSSDTIQDVLYTAVTPGSSGNLISVQYTPGATAGSEVVTVNPEAVGTIKTFPTDGDPRNLAFDGINMWASNTDTNSISKISPTGMVLAEYFGLSGAVGIAFDGINMWVGNTGGDTVSKVTPDGIIHTFSGPISFPSGLDFDGMNIWVANRNSNSVTKVSPDGTMVNYPGTGMNPFGIAFNSVTGDMWTADFTGNSVTKFTPSGTPTIYPLTVGVNPTAIAFDGINMWVSCNGNNSVSKISPSGVETNYAGAGNGPNGIAFDGTNMWTCNFIGNSVTRVTSSGVMTTYASVGSAPTGIAFDGANFMWVANNGSNDYSRVAVTGVGPVTAISVQIEDGVSTASQIVSAVSGFGAAAVLVIPSTGSPATVQNVSSAATPQFLTGGLDDMAATFRTALTTYTYLLYTAVTPGTPGNSITIEYTSGGTAGSEIVTVVVNAISVQIEVGRSRAAQIVSAVNGHPAAAALVTAYTNNRMAIALSGATQDSSGMFVSEASPKTLYKIDTVTLDGTEQMDVPLVGTPDDIVFDGGNIWVLDFSSAIINRILAPNGQPQSTINVAASGLPRRMAQAVPSGALWVTMSNGDLVRADGYANGAIVEAFQSGFTSVSGISNLGGNDFFISFVSPQNKVTRFYFDGGAYKHFISTRTVADSPDTLAVDGIANFWTFTNGDPTLRKINMQTGASPLSTDITAYGSPKSMTLVGGRIYVSLSNGKMLFADQTTGSVIDTRTSGKSVLAGISSQGIGSWGLAVGFTSPTNGYLRFLAPFMGKPESFYYTGTVVSGQPSGMSADATDLWVANLSGGADVPRKLSVTSMAITLSVTGMTEQSQFVTVAGGFAFFDTNQNTSSYVKKVDTTTGVDTNIDMASSANRCSRIFLGGTSLWVMGSGFTTGGGPETLERWTSAGRPIASIVSYDGFEQFNSNSTLVMVGSALFVGGSGRLHRFVTELG